MNDLSLDRLSGALGRDSVKKHVAAIHVSGKLSLLQRKLSNVLLLNAYDTLTQAERFRIDARTLCLLAGYNSNDFETLKQSLKGLAETVAEWDMLDAEGRQEWGVSSLLSYATLKDGVCEYAYSPALAAKLHDPKIFALIDLNIQRGFSSGHALALYENCFRFVRIGTTGWWDLDTFRRLMGVADSDYYQVFKHLNAKIIKPAVAEVNKTSNILIEPELRKQGRAVSEIRFSIKKNPQLAILDIDDGAGARKSPVYDQMRGLGVSDRLSRQWIAQYGEDYVSEKLAYVGAQANVQEPAKYLSAAIKRNYPQGDVEPSKPLSKRAKQLGQIQSAVRQRTATQRDADLALFASSISSEDARADFERHGWMSSLNKRAIVDFWKDLSPEIFETDA